MEPRDGQNAADSIDASSPAAPDAVVGPDAPVERVSSVTAPVAGNESVAFALRELASVGDLPLAEHPDAFGRVHTGLQQALSDIDDA